MPVWKRRRTRERISMAERIPEAWIGQEVTLYFGSEVHRHRGILESASELGIVVRSTHGGEDEHVFWNPPNLCNPAHAGHAAESGSTLILNP